MPAGAIVLDGQELQLARGPDGGSWAYLTHVQASLPGQQDPDEAKVSRSAPEHRRTLPWLDWSGGLGAAKVDARSYFGGRANNRLHYSEGPTGRNPGRLVRGHEKRTVAPANGNGSVTDFFETGATSSSLYAVIGSTVRQLTLTLNAETVAARRPDGAGNGDATGVYVSGTTFTTASPAWYDATSTKHFVGTTAVAAPAVSFNRIATWAAAGATAASYWALGTYGDGQRLWAASCPDDANGVYVCNLAVGQNPFGAALGLSPWSVRFPLGNRAAGITGLAALRENLILTCTDGLIYAIPYQTGLPVPLPGSQDVIPSATSGLQMNVWNGLLVVPSPRGLLLYQEEAGGPGSFVSIGPESLYGNEMPSVGQCTALYAGDPEYLWAAFYDGTDSWVWALRRPYPGEPVASRMVADTLGVGRIPAKQVTALHLSHLGTNPVLIAGSTVPDLTFVTLPRQGRNVIGPNADGNVRSATSKESCFLPDQDGGAPTTTKPFRRLRFKTRGFSAQEYVNVAIRVDRADYAQVGTINASPVQTLNLPATAEGASIGLQLDWYGTTALATYPQIEAIEVDATERPETSTWIDVGVYVAARQQTAYGTSLTGPLEVVAFLSRLAEQVRHVDFVDPQDQVNVVCVDAFTGVHTEYAEQLPDRAPGYVVRFRLNVYGELLTHVVATYGVSVYTGGATTSYYG